MAHHDFPVTRELKIKLDFGGAHLLGETESRQRVLRRIGRSAAVGDDPEARWDGYGELGLIHVARHRFYNDREIHGLIEDKLQKGQGNKAYYAGNDRGRHPARSDACQDAIVHPTSALQNAESKHGADHRLGAGYRHQRYRRQPGIAKQGFQSL